PREPRPASRIDPTSSCLAPGRIAPAVSRTLIRGLLAPGPQLLRGSPAMNLRQFLDRYGVSLAVLAVLALVVAIVPGNSKNAAQVGTTGGSSGGRGRGSVTARGEGVCGAGAVRGSTAVASGWGAGG